jgi:hypothetical protein
MKNQAEINWGILSSYLDGDAAIEQTTVKTRTTKAKTPTSNAPIPLQSSAAAVTKGSIRLPSAELAIQPDSTSTQTPPLIISASENGSSLKAIHTAAGLLSNAWEWFRARQGARSTTKRLEVATTVSLGEKRFVAVIKIDGQQFLVGGGATNVSLLAQLNSSETFSDLLKGTMSVADAEPASQPIKKSTKLSLKRAGAQA